MSALRFSSAARKFEQVNAILADVNDGEDVPSSLPLGKRQGLDQLNVRCTLKGVSV